MARSSREAIDRELGSTANPSLPYGPARATRLNHAGIILYEAMAALFISQAFGLDLSLPSQITIAVTSLMAGIGIAGVAEAGLVTLPLVLSAVGLPAAVTSTVIPLVLPVDWIIGRGRAAANVASDMAVGVVLDRWSPEETAPPDSGPDLPTEPEPDPELAGSLR